MSVNLPTIDGSNNEPDQTFRAKIGTAFKTIASAFNGGVGALASASGTFVANDATSVTVANTAVTANSQILMTLKTVGGTILGLPYIMTITPGTGFTVRAGAADTSTYNYTIIG